MSSRLDDAIATLYGGDPDAFTERRDQLAAAARSDGEPAAAKEIAALRKPIRAAALVNRHVRQQPETIDDLVALGAEIRKAQRIMDGQALRELTGRRRQAISAAANAALAGGAEAMRGPITSTFEAALADPDIAEQVRAGALVRPIEWSGFGDATPSLTLVPAPAPARSPKAARARPNTPPRRPDKAATARAAARERQISEAGQELDDAQQAVTTTAQLRTEATARIEQLETDLVQARLDLRAATAQHRSAQDRHRDADRRLRRVRGASS